MNISDLETWFDRSLPKQFQINACERTEDLRGTVDSHIEYLKANKGNKLFLPFYQRLILIKEKLSNENTPTSQG